MAGYFVITLAREATQPPVIDVTVTGYEGFKGTVYLSYSTDPNTPYTIDPTSDNVYLTQNGSATTTARFYVPQFSGAWFYADGNDGGSLLDHESIFVAN